MTRLVDTLLLLARGDAGILKINQTSINLREHAADTIELLNVLAEEKGQSIHLEGPTIKMLALSFLILIGVMLVAEGIGTHINKGYIYFAMAFSLVVEFLNMKVRGRLRPVPTPAEEASL